MNISKDENIELVELEAILNGGKLTISGQIVITCENSKPI